MAKVKSVDPVLEVSFDEVHKWFDDNMAVDKIDLEDPEVFKVYERGDWCGVFQCVDEQTQVYLSDGTQKCIKDLSVGQRVKAYDTAQQKVVNANIDAIYDQGVKDCIELAFDDGRRLTCTIEHKILTQRGWVPAGDLTLDDDVVGFSVT